MDWKECVTKNIVKQVAEDKNKIDSIKKIAGLKINSADFLPESHFIAKITLLYDALREYLEVTA